MRLYFIFEIVFIVQIVVQNISFIKVILIVDNLNFVFRFLANYIVLEIMVPLFRLTISKLVIFTLGFLLILTFHVFKLI